MTFSAYAGCASVQIEAETPEQAAEIAEPMLREILIPHVSPDEDEWPREMVINEGSQGIGRDHTYSFGQ